MFFDDLDLSLKKNVTLKSAPPIPATKWAPPGYFPNLSGADFIAFDVETKEPDLEHGPGWARGKGHIVGVAVGAHFSDSSKDRAWYFPVRHEVQSDMNLDAAQVFRWLKHTLETDHIPKVGANLLYDVGWLTEENIYVLGDLHDVQFAEALLQEEGLVNLDHLGLKYCGCGKESSLLYKWCADAYGGSVSGSQRSNIYRAPPSLVGLYAESDVLLPLSVLKKQLVLLENEHLMDVYRMECESIYYLVRMRIAGVTVDVKKAELIYGKLSESIGSQQKHLFDQTGVHVNVDSSKDLAKLFDSVGLVYPQTSKGSPSFAKDFLKTVDHPVVRLIQNIRECRIVQNTFIKSYILESNVNGKLHTQFHPLRAEKYGTRSGRFASTNPNLQNIPVRTELGKSIRSLFIPDSGHILLEKNDQSQIEYRFLAHFAVGAGSDYVRLQYNSDRKTDYHALTQLLVKQQAGISIDRKPIKTVNFGLLYGMSEGALSRELGLDSATASKLFKAYHKGNPYVKATMCEISDDAQKKGYVCTVLGRRSRFTAWEPKQVDYGNRATPLPYDRAVELYGIFIQRSSTYKAINRLLQGSAADAFKKALQKCVSSGVFDVIGVPRLQVHDELVFSVIDDSREQNEAYAEMHNILETAVKLRVPLLVDTGRGHNWGSIE